MSDSPARGDAYNFKTVAVSQRVPGEFRGGDRFAVEFDHNTAWQKLLQFEELEERARRL